MKKRRYYLPNEKYGLLTKLKNIVYGKKIERFPEAIVLESVSACNARCVFCAQHKLRKSLPTGTMSDDLFHKIADECSHYSGLLKRFSFAFDNEPLLDKKLLDRISYVKQKCPFVRTNITTNGILLNKEIIERIYEKEIVDEMNISIQSIRKETYEKITGVKKYEQVMRNMDDLSTIHRAHNAKKPVIVINTCLTSETIHERDAIFNHWNERGFRSNFIKLDNRSHNESEFSRLTDNAVSYYQYCRRPFHTMVICWDGEVPLCCADYSRSCVVGDVSRESLYDVWNGNRIYRARKEMITGEFKYAAICSTCEMES